MQTCPIGIPRVYRRQLSSTDYSPAPRQLSSAESSLRVEQARRRQLADQLTAEQQRSWRLQAEARDMQTQLLRAMTLQPMPMASQGFQGMAPTGFAGMAPTGFSAMAPTGLAEMAEALRPRSETMDKVSRRTRSARCVVRWGFREGSVK